MTPYTQDMTQLATYWPPAGADGFGSTTFGAPAGIACRWQDRGVLFRDVQGREVTSSAVVYVDSPLLPSGYLALGGHVEADPHAVAGAKEVRQVGMSPDLDGAEVLHKAWL